MPDANFTTPDDFDELLDAELAAAGDPADPDFTGELDDMEAQLDAELDNLQAVSALQQLQTLIQEDIASSGVLIYDLETIPDESRFPAPAESKPIGIKEPLPGLLEKTANEIAKALEDATAEQLLELRTLEDSAKSPRKTVLSKIDQLMKQFNGAHEKWVKTHSVDPWSCRICSFAWAIGGREPRALTATNDDEERALLQVFWQLLKSPTATGDSKPRVRIGYNILAFDDMVILNRSRRLGVPVSVPLDLRKYNNSQAIDLIQRIFPNSSPQKCKTVAAAWGVSIPCPDVDGSQVYDLYQAGALDKIAEYNRSDVAVERELYTIAAGLLA